jgi:hypothetical protein
VSALVRLLLLLALSSPSIARAADGAAALVLQAEQAERQGEAERALELYASAARAEPGSRWARRAQIRIDWLKTRLDEAGAPALSALLRMRALAGGELTRARVDELARGLSELPPGSVRRESRALAAGAYERLGELPAALGEYLAWLDEPGSDAAERRLAATGAARCQEALGDRAGALETLRRAEQGATPEARKLALESVAQRARPIAALVIALFVLSCAVIGRRGFGWRALRQAFSPAHVGVGLWLFAVPLLLAAAHSPEALHALVAAVAALAPILAWSALAGSALDVAGAGGRARDALAALGVITLLAGLYLALDRSGTLLELALAIGKA